MRSVLTAASAAWLGWAEGLAVQPDLSVCEWAAEHRVLVPPEPEPGPWRNDRTPYLVGIMDTCSPEHPARHITFMAGVQTGKTSGVALNVAGWAVYTGGHSIVVGTPAESDAKEWSGRLMSMLSSSGAPGGQVFESRGAKKAGQMTTRMLYRGNGTQIKFGWSGSPRTFAMTQASIVIGDEVDRWVTRKEGSPEDLLANRATNSARAKIIFISSPVIESMSRIYQKFRAGDQRLYFIPCPHCGHFQTLEWDRMLWPKRPECQETAGQQLARCSEIGMQCIACEQLIREQAKGRFLSEGLWLATQGREDFAARGFDSGDLKAMAPIFSEMGRAVYVSFQLSSLYAPWGWKGASWPDLAMAYEQAKGDPDKHKAFVTTRLARPWKDNAQRPEAEVIADRREDYPLGVVPTGAAFVTVFSDVQKDRLEYEALAHGPQGETWSIEYRVIEGSPETQAPWDELRRVLYRNWPTEGGMTLPTHALGIDTGYMPKLAEAFAYAESRPAVNASGYRINHPRTVVLTKGATRGWNRAIESYSPYEAAHKRGGLYIFHLGTSFLKARLYEHLRASDGYGKCHFPAVYEMPYFDGLTAEELVIDRGKSVFRKVGNARNEPLDARVGNMALAEMLALHRLTEADWKARIAATIKTDLAPIPQPQASYAGGRRVRGILS